MRFCSRELWFQEYQAGVARLHLTSAELLAGTIFGLGLVGFRVLRLGAICSIS